MEVKQLITPLCDDSEGILDESDDNQETADSWKISG